MDLIIVESPSKAKTITKYLKGKYRVDASAGHIRDLPVHTLGVDLKNNFEPKYVNSEGKEDVIRRLTDATKKTDRVYLATAPDARERRSLGTCRRFWDLTSRARTVSNLTRFPNARLKRR